MSRVGRLRWVGGGARRAPAPMPVTKFFRSVALHAETDRPVYSRRRDLDSPVAAWPRLGRRAAGVIQVSRIDDAAAGIANDQRPAARREGTVLGHRRRCPVVPPRVAA